MAIIDSTIKVTLEGHIEIPECDMEAVLLELPTHIELTKNEEGCLVFRVERDKNDNYRFNVYEEFRNNEAFAKHQERVKKSRWGSITKNAKREYTITHGEYENE